MGDADNAALSNPIYSTFFGAMGATASIVFRDGPSIYDVCKKVGFYLLPLCLQNPVIHKVLKTRIWGVPPGLLGQYCSRYLQ